MCDHDRDRDSYPDPAPDLSQYMTLDLDPAHQMRQDAIECFMAGMTLEDGTSCAPAILEVLESSMVRVTLHEGFFHQASLTYAPASTPSMA